MKKYWIVTIICIFCRLVYSQPYPPNPLYPNGDTCASTQNIHFNWFHSIGATSYGLQVLSGATTVLNISGITDTFYIPSTGIFTLSTYYYWRLNASGPSGTGMWSSMYHFITCPSIPGSPTLAFPADSSENVSLIPVMDWTDVPGASQYRIQISTSPGFSSTVLDVDGLTNSGYLISSGVLSYCTRYYWRANASNPFGTGQWSEVWTFKTICQSSINLISSEIPTENKLYNNYPNPFNPNTIIKFNIKDSRPVTLKIFDILGKEVSTLINGKLLSGIYEVSFDGSNFPSGVYFYTIRAGKFTDTKRMLLLK